MVDIVHEAASLIEKNRYTILGTLVLAGVLALSGCQVTTTSPTTGEQVTGAQLEIEADQAEAQLDAERRADQEQLQGKLDALEARHAAELAEVLAEGKAEDAEREARASAQAAKFKSANADLDEKFRRLGVVFDVAGQVGGLFSPQVSGLLNVGLTALATGIFADNRRKSGVIKDLKVATATTSTTAA